MAALPIFIRGPRPTQTAPSSSTSRGGTTPFFKPKKNKSKPTAKHTRTRGDSSDSSDNDDSTSLSTSTASTFLSETESSSSEEEEEEDDDEDEDERSSSLTTEPLERATKTTTTTTLSTAISELLTEVDEDEDDGDSSASSDSPPDQFDLYSSAIKFLSDTGAAARTRLRGFASARSSPILAHPPEVSTPTRTSTSSIGHSRAHLRLSLALLRVRQALSTSSFDQLLTALRALSASLGADMTTLGVFLPILDRLSYDLEAGLNDEKKGREYRKELNHADAKALIALKQRWNQAIASSGSELLGSGSAKGKGKETEYDWVDAVRTVVLQHKPSRPAIITGRQDIVAATILTSLESLLLPSSLPRINLSNLGMTSEQFENLDVLREAEPVLDWYLSFVAPGEGKTTLSGRNMLNRVTSLDLSKNKLHTLPSYLHRIFPSLESLSISNNQFRHIPSTIVLFSSLRRLRRHGNNLGKRRTRQSRSRIGLGEISQTDGDQSGGTHSNTRRMVELILKRRKLVSESDHQLQNRVESLSSVSIRILHHNLPSFTSSTSQALLGSLPPHLHAIVLKSYACASCDKFITPLSNPLDHLPAFYERVHHLDPGVSLPSSNPSIPVRRGSPILGSSSSPPQRAPQVPVPSARYVLTLEERVLLALYGRSTQLHTLVIGDERYHRFCLNCAGSHLGVDQFDEEDDEGKEKCVCDICREERRVKGEEIEEDGHAAQEVKRSGVMRWLRRKADRASLVEL